MQKLKQGDIIVVIAGKDKGKQGTVLKILKAKSKVLVEGINLVKKHTKPTGPGTPSGIISQERPLAISNVMALDPNSGKPSKIGIKILENGSKVRYYKRSGDLVTENRNYKKKEAK